ncbi:MAG: 3,4-dihydroxy-2-butanone-4-phosphate synthase [Candidatus Marinimicrobia bacterium]|nr:3,4-dihydroxy-2-butanone-4-phosphate synthase [Candidatus Neomarinimicrobiota bacterium]|tara:strand:+ start:411 stop:1547 length:1137 start_codon:yes stop_codon:yes gene_type:complete
MSEANETSHQDFSEFLSPVEEIIEDARNGRMFILVDDQDRENEGDLIIPAQMATPDAVNFMAKHGRGLICLSLPRLRVEKLGLPLLPAQNQSRLATAFTLSIEAREGVTTGISAADRARTIAVAIDPASLPRDLATPGHVFPLMAKDGGVLVRAGHTEAAVDIAKLAGLIPAGVICEIMNDDGSMARMPDLIKFAQHHGLKIATIADLIAYRRSKERLVRMEAEAPFKSHLGGQWLSRVYKDNITNDEQLVLIKGNVDGSEPVMVRMHHLNLLPDVLADAESIRTGELQTAMQMITDYRRGVIVFFREAPGGLTERIRALASGTEHTRRLMDYGVGAQILVDLGVRNMILLTNTSKIIVGLEGHGLRVTDQRAIIQDK